MSKWHPRIPNPLAEIEMESILEDALRLLSEVGVACAHEETVCRLLDWGGTSCKDGRIRFAPQKLRSRLEGRRIPDERPDKGFSLGACWACLNYCDPETGAARPAASEDVARMCRL
ncbi:MAG: hypothetical protein IT210_26010 [Armatimonadetes bacterium]|nr:hypothetical protein [Armatimonadota bacterium]